MLRRRATMLIVSGGLVLGLIVLGPRLLDAVWPAPRQPSIRDDPVMALMGGLRELAFYELVGDPLVCADPDELRRFEAVLRQAGQSRSIDDSVVPKDPRRGPHFELRYDHRRPHYVRVFTDEAWTFVNRHGHEITFRGTGLARYLESFGTGCEPAASRR